MTLITKGMGIIRKGVEKLGGSEKGKPHSTRAGRRAAGSRRLKRGFKEISTPFIDESIFIKQFKKMKKDKVTPELTGLLTGIKNISKDQSKLGKGKERTRKGLGGALKVAKAIASKVFKKKPKPSKENQWKGESWFDFVDRKDAEDAISGGWPPPKVKVGKIAKNIIKGGVALPVGAAGASYVHGKWKRHLKKKDKDKERTKKGIGGLLSKGFKVLKGPANKFRMDQAQRLKTYRSKQKLKKTKEARIQEGKSKEFQEKYIKPLSPETKVKISKQISPKSWRRAGKK